ncbi:MAG: hypothetical protein HY713_12240 [candidate division NC10 bacterium]|nr:hypothetical protein [candidate division NC10 bacterium]
MPLCEAEAVGILTEKRVTSARAVVDDPVVDRVGELALRARESVLTPFLTGRGESGLGEELEEAARRFRTIRLEVNWCIIKSQGLAALLSQSTESMRGLQESLAKSDLSRETWAVECARWLNRLLGEYDALKSLGPLLEALPLDLRQMPLEWIERWLPSTVQSADIESFVLSCVASVVDGEITRYNPRRLAYAVKTGSDLEPEYVRFLRVWCHIVQDVLGAPEKYNNLRLSLAPDSLTIWLVIAVSGLRQEFNWFASLSRLCEQTFPTAKSYRLTGARDPEEPEVVKLRLHIHTEDPPRSLVASEARFWNELESHVGPQLLDLIVLSYRPPANGSPRLS